MIGKIKGALVEVEGNLGLIETTGGVFYNVFLTNTLLAQCIPPNPIECYTFLQVRDDALVLFGFENKQEFKLFTLLTGVSGVGPKTAFGIISFSKVHEFVTAVKTNDTSYFTRVPGLGKKTALKIMLELSGKFDSEFVFEPTFISDDDKMVIEAMTSLGFKATEAKTMLEKIDKTKSTEEKITESIRMLSSK